LKNQSCIQNTSMIVVDDDDLFGFKKKEKIMDGFDDK
jgi:hypothetical protein